MKAVDPLNGMNVLLEFETRDCTQRLKTMDDVVPNLFIKY